MLFGRKQKELEDKLDVERVTNRALHAQITSLIITREEAKEKAATGTACIEALLGRGIEWYDPSKLDYEAQVSYWNTARSLLDNDVLMNEFNHYVADTIEHGVLQSKDYQELYGVRMSINGAKALIERLKEIPDPRTHETHDDLHALI